jgi:hypothetical protein
MQHGLTTNDTEKWEDPEVEGRNKFKTSEHKNELYYHTLGLSGGKMATRKIFQIPSQQNLRTLERMTMCLYFIIVKTAVKLCDPINT